jgi:hypothetical protein
MLQTTEGRTAFGLDDIAAKNGVTPKEFIETLKDIDPDILETLLDPFHERNCPEGYRNEEAYYNQLSILVPPPNFSEPNILTKRLYIPIRNNKQPDDEILEIAPGLLRKRWTINYTLLDRDLFVFCFFRLFVE